MQYNGRRSFIDLARFDTYQTILNMINAPDTIFTCLLIQCLNQLDPVSFLAVDEIQIAADLERGHVFTDRILHRRGRDETLLLGAATMRPIIERTEPTPRPSSAARRLRTRRWMNQGRLRPLSASSL